MEILICQPWGCQQRLSPDMADMGERSRPEKPQIGPGSQAISSIP